MIKLSSESVDLLPSKMVACLISWFAGLLIYLNIRNNWLIAWLGDWMLITVSLTPSLPNFNNKPTTVKDTPGELYWHLFSIALDYCWYCRQSRLIFFMTLFPGITSVCSVRGEVRKGLLQLIQACQVSSMIRPTFAGLVGLYWRWYQQPLADRFYVLPWLSISTLSSGKWTLLLCYYPNRDDGAY